MSLAEQCKTCWYNFKNPSEWCYMFRREPDVSLCMAYRKDRYAEEPQNEQTLPSVQADPSVQR